MKKYWKEIAACLSLLLLMGALFVGNYIANSPPSVF